MALEIWKFPLTDFRSCVDMPTHARPLSIGFQGTSLYLWAAVQTSNPTAKRTFAVVMTGQPTDDAVGPFLGTATSPDGYVVHVFDRGYDDGADR